MIEYLWFLAKLATVVVLVAIVVMLVLRSTMGFAAAAPQTSAWRLRALHEERRDLHAALQRSAESSCERWAADGGAFGAGRKGFMARLRRTLRRAGLPTDHEDDRDGAPTKDRAGDKGAQRAAAGLVAAGSPASIGVAEGAVEGPAGGPGSSRQASDAQAHGASGSSSDGSGVVAAANAAQGEDSDTADTAASAGVVGEGIGEVDTIGSAVSAKRVPRRFVIDFHGDVQASAVGRLAREVSTLLALAEPGDEVLVRLESAGGVVHGYGLGAAELLRLRKAGLRVVVAVDRVAASGGYMMACVADEIVASPFAIVGSIGVVAQLPNFHRWLDARDVDFELLTAGEHKRTLTIFGENTPEGRAKMQADLDDTHSLFKTFVKRSRPSLDVERVADGAYWYGERALALGLVDRLITSEALLHDWVAAGPVFHLQRRSRKALAERLQDAFGTALRAWRGATAEAVTPPAGSDRWLR